MRNNNIANDVFRYVVKLAADDFAALTVKMLAEHFNVSRCHISRRFHNERGMTLTTFIKRQKLLRAERLLAADSDVTVKQLASRLGYADYQYFIARFREQWGESPGRYRKLYAELSE
ncbi:MAG: AraC family transcriptional regulator [Candidatus Aminicenantes bacterium]|nr:AraC family transcriptional regulator [Candidatus Aminicenantes bacterium]